MPRPVLRVRGPPDTRSSPASERLCRDVCRFTADSRSRPVGCTPRGWLKSLFTPAGYRESALVDELGDVSYLTNPSRCFEDCPSDDLARGFLGFGEGHHKLSKGAVSLPVRREQS